MFNREILNQTVAQRKNRYCEITSTSVSFEKNSLFVEFSDSCNNIFFFNLSKIHAQSYSNLRHRYSSAFNSICGATSKFSELRLCCPFVWCKLVWIIRLEVGFCATIFLSFHANHLSKPLKSAKG